MLINKNSHILHELQKVNASIESPCQGNGTCGKCKVQLVSGKLPVTHAEKKLLTQSQLDSGIRLACQHPHIKETVEVELVTRYMEADILGTEKKSISLSKFEDVLSIVVDIGTTTLVIAVIDHRNGQIVSQKRLLNPQRSYGHDVLSRIEACKQFGVETLQKLVVSVIENEIKIINESRKINQMLVCGNAVMQTIFCKEDPTSLGGYPFELVLKGTITRKSTDFFSNVQPFDVIILPSISSYVGGDIVAGIIALDLLTKNHCLLIDLGTNGEMALSSDGTIRTTSVAAGPAFEGGNMDCGIASVEGAVYDIKMNHAITVETIYRGQPIGICGSGYISGIAALRRNNLIDETGYMEHNVWITDTIHISPKDIRNFQLAKSAVRTGIEIMLKEERLDADAIEEVYISGGFGSSNHVDYLIELGILPKELLKKVHIIGNSALDGLLKLVEMQSFSEVDQIIKVCENVNLAEHPQFLDEYTRNMWFYD